MSSQLKYRKMLFLKLVSIFAVLCFSSLVECRRKITKPEPRSIQSSVIMLLGNITNPTKIKQSLLRDLILELIEPGNGCDGTGDYSLARGIAAGELLDPDARTYKGYSVVSSKNTEPLLYEPLLESEPPISPDVEFVENPLSGSKSEDHNLRKHYSCYGEGVGSLFYSHFYYAILPTFPGNLTKVIKFVLGQKGKFLKIYQTLKRVASTNIEYPSFARIEKIIQPAIDDMTTIKKRAELDCKFW